jgi:hypothetical protein
MLRECVDTMIDQGYIPTSKELKRMSKLGLQCCMTARVCKYFCDTVCNGDLRQIMDLSWSFHHIHRDIITKLMLSYWNVDLEQVKQYSGDCFIHHMYEITTDLDDILDAMTSQGIVGCLLHDSGREIIKGYPHIILKYSEEYQLYALSLPAAIVLLDLGIKVDIWEVCIDIDYSFRDLGRLHRFIGLDLQTHFPMIENCTVQAYHYSVACSLLKLERDDDLIDACVQYFRDYIEYKKDVGEIKESKLLEITSDITYHLTSNTYWCVRSEFQDTLRDKLLILLSNVE